MGYREIKKEIRKYIEKNKAQNTTYQNLRGATKVVLKNKFIVVNTCIKKGERSQIVTSFYTSGK